MSVSSSKRNRNSNNDRRTKQEAYVPATSTPSYNKSFKTIVPKNYIQGVYLEAIKQNDITFGTGSAGTGKTYVAAMYAAEELFHRRIDKIIITRPNVECGPSLGFLPGELEEKYAPYLEPFADVFKRALGVGFYEYALKSKQIDPRPMGFMRGSTFENCILLIDECQQMSSKEFKMILSRIGNNCKVILSGDSSQSDVSNSGLDDAVRRLSYIKGIEVVNFRNEDIVRSAMCKKVIVAYED